MPQAAAGVLEDDLGLLDQLLFVGDGSPSVEEKLEMMQLMRGRSRARTRRVDQRLIERLDALGVGLAEARQRLQELGELTSQLLSPAWYPATFFELLPDPGGPRALVVHNGTARVVTLGTGVAPESLAAGDEVLLGKELNLVLGCSGRRAARWGEVAEFRRRLADGRMVLRARDEEFVLYAGRGLADVDLSPGDLVCWDRQTHLASERLERAEGERYLLSEAPDAARTRLGGGERDFDLLLSTLSAQLVDREAAARYGLGGRHSVLLYGPPGCGKTLMARIAAAEISRLSGRRCRIAVVKPAEWESPWVGETQRNIRDCFASLQQLAAEGDMAVLFLDEIEAVGRIRGGTGGVHADKFLAALLAELDGFGARGDVAVIAATNRKDLVDPALLERLSDVEIAVPRPNLRAAREIFSIHLPTSLPYSPDGGAAEETRATVVDAAVSRFYSPGGDNDICILRLRDGSTRTVCARDLASGRIFEQVCRAARHAAFLREKRHGDSGLRVADIETAALEAMRRLASTLSPRNAHAYLGDLPEDVDVVNVEPIRRRVPLPHVYLNTPLPVSATEGRAGAPQAQSPTTSPTP